MKAEIVSYIATATVAVAFIVAFAVLFHANVEATNKTSIACIEQGKEWKGNRCTESGNE